MSDILEKIGAYKREEIRAAETALPLAELKARIADVTPPRGFEKALRAKLAAGDYGLIAEIKKASPSKGLIREDFDPPSLAKAYEQGGAACLSVLTDAPYFQGHESFMMQARAATSLPVLRKDFMVDPWQIAESRMIGADAILIIVAALEDEQMREIEAAALERGMDVLIEVHDEDEMERAAKHLTSRLIGVNNRDLTTFDVDIGTAERLAPLVADMPVAVAESGIWTRADAGRMRVAGYDAVLVGESLVRAPDRAALLADLRSNR